MAETEIKKQLQNELDRYLKGEVDFSPYYQGMNILSSNLYIKHLEDVLDFVKKQDGSDVKNFELYLQTIIINLQTKLKKYKKSVYFDDENVKDIQNQGFTIPFYVDEKNNVYVLLGIVK